MTTSTESVHTPEPSVHIADGHVAELLRGAIDLHVHPGPSPFPRRIGILEAARHYEAAGFRAMFVKSHHHSMVTDVLALADAGLSDLDIAVSSGVALNNQVGGVNPYAVELALSQGGRIVWFPTIAAGKHICEHDSLNFPHATVNLRPSRPVRVLDDDGRLLDEVCDVLSLIRAHDAVLAGGHLDAAELRVVIDTALSMGIRRIVVNHPNFVVGASAADCREWAEKGVYIEHSLCMYDDRSTFFHWKLDILLDYIEAAGPERTLLCSDLGQANNPLPVESYASTVRALLDLDVPAATVRTLIGGAAARLIDA